MSSRSANDRYRPDSGVSWIDGMPPRSRNQRTPTGPDTPHAIAASSLESPSAIFIQNPRSTSRRTGGRPGDRIAGRPVSVTIHPRGRPIQHLHLEMLRRPVEFTLSRPLLEVRAPDLARPERVVRPPGETQHAGQLDRATLAQVLEVRRLVEGAPELRVRGPLAHRDPDLRTRMTWASAWPPGRTPSSESPRAPAAHAAAARYAAEASKRLKMRPPPAGPRTRAPADRDCETPSASPYTDSSTVFEIRLESEGLARPCPPTTSASAVSSPIADPAKGIPRKPRPSAALPRTISARSGRRRASRPTSQPWTTTATRPMYTQSQSTCAWL